MAIWRAADGTEIYYELHGDRPDRPTLVLLPGLLGAIETQWQSFVPALGKEYRLLLADLRGHGRSGNNDHRLQIETLLADLNGLLDAVGGGAVHIAGYSLGGYLGLMLALNQPRRVATLLMHATKFYWTADAVAAMQRQLDPDQMATKVPHYATQLAHEHGARRWRGLVRQAGDLVALLSQQGLTEGMAARAQCPVLISVGDRDELVALPEAHRLMRIMPGGQLLVLPGTRHAFSAVKPVPLLPTMQQFHRADGRL